jgi:arabinosaccharide transport system substrate-binding protein
MFRLPIGPAPTLLLVLFLLTAAWMLFNASTAEPPAGEEPKTVLRLWTFALMHYEDYLESVPAFEAAHPGVKVQVELVHMRAVTTRLQSAMWAGLEVPDLVEVEISYVGRFFRGPLEGIGFMDLTDKLHETGIYERFVKTRWSAYSSRGRIFGFPRAVCPVMLAYRRDIFEEEGIDPSQLDTWDKFIEAGRKVTRDLDGDGTVDRYMLNLSESSALDFEILLFQRGGGYFDVNGNFVMDNETAVEAMKWYVPLVAGKDRIANSLGDAQILTQAVEKGYLVSHLCADWRTKVFEQDIPRVSGKMGLMPLPKFSPEGRGTSTSGGTMLAITDTSPNKELAWDLATYLYCDQEQQAERFKNTNIIPPLREAWDLPAFNTPREYWSAQPIGALFAALADETPPQYASPYTPIAKAKLSEALVACVLRYQRHGEEDFEDFVRETLTAKANMVRNLIERNPFQ